MLYNLSLYFFLAFLDLLDQVRLLVLLVQCIVQVYVFPPVELL